MLANKKGSGLAELIIALTILNIILLSLIPSFIYTTKATLRNNFRTNAYNLGIRQLERVKSLDYEEVGIKNGNPNGVIDYTKNEVRAGVGYLVKTRISWVDDPADETYPLDNDPRDFKRVQVYVNLPSSSGLPSQVFTTDITRQSQEQIALGGNIEVNVVDEKNNPLEEATAKITSGPSSPMESHTDESGKTTFVMLNESAQEGDYSLSVELASYVAEPTMRTQTTTVRRGETRILQFTLSKPGKLRLSLVDEDTGEGLASESKVSMLYPSASAIEYSSNTGSFFIEDLYPGIYEIKAENANYELTSERDVRIEVGRTTTLTLRLKRKRQGNLHLTVVDEQTGNAIPYASVLINGLDTPLTVQDMTNVQGILEKQLGQQRFSLKVSKTNYQTNLSTFTIARTGNTFVRVALRRNSPTGGTIRVIVQNRNGNSVEGVRILTLGPGGYRRDVRTDADGQAVFSGLIYGWYSVYRWGWGWRLVGQPLIRNGEERTYIVRY